MSTVISRVVKAKIQTKKKTRNKLIHVAIASSEVLVFMTAFSPSLQYHLNSISLTKILKLIRKSALKNTKKF